MKQTRKTPSAAKTAAVQIPTLSLMPYVQEQAKSQNCSVEDFLDLSADSVTEGSGSRSKSSEDYSIRLANNTNLDAQEVRLMRSAMGNYGRRIQNIVIGDFVRDVKAQLRAEQRKKTSRTTTSLPSKTT